MKTTIDIADPLLKEAQRVATERGLTLKEIVEEALRASLHAGRPGRKARPFKMRPFRGDGLQPGVDWSDWEGRRGLAYEGRGG